MTQPKLSDEEIATRLQALAHWTRSGDHIERTFVFADFRQAFGWMASVATAAEALNHHPDWSNVYKTVKVQLSTHDAGGITELDFKLAAEMDRLAG